MDNKDSANKILWMNSEDLSAVIIGVGFLILVGVIFVFTLRTMHTADAFLTVWSAVGPIVGVVIGAMPARFFRSMANAADQRTDAANQRTDAANQRADGMAEDMANMAKDMADLGKQMAHGSQ